MSSLPPCPVCQSVYTYEDGSHSPRPTTLSNCFLEQACEPIDCLESDMAAHLVGNPTLRGATQRSKKAMTLEATA